ncbi:MAG: sugar phosphate isomerase/epimerase [Thermomicrobiales bacterium]|nr:sugar phosphate isomerase/epimerase [Thermomicrobiales bacterium]
MIVRPENPIAVQLYTVREAARNDFPGTLRRLAEGGARAVEFAGYGGMAIPELRALLDELGMRVAGSHVPLTAWEGQPDATQFAPLADGDGSTLFDILVQETDPNLVGIEV